MKNYLIILLAFFLLGCGDSLKDDYTHCKILSSGNPDLTARSVDQSQCFRISSTPSKSNALMQCEFLTSRYMVDRYGLIYEHIYEASSKRC